MHASSAIIHKERVRFVVASRRMLSTWLVGPELNLDVEAEHEWAYNKQIDLM